MRKGPARPLPLVDKTIWRDGDTKLIGKLIKTHPGPVILRNTQRHVLQRRTRRLVRNSPANVSHNYAAGRRERPQRKNPTNATASTPTPAMIPKAERWASTPEPSWGV